MATNPKPQNPWGVVHPVHGLMTVEEFEQLPGEDGWIYELQQGRLITMPGPGNAHMIIQEQVMFTVGQYLRTHHLGHLRGTGCYNLPLPGNTEEVRCPDLSYIEPEREATMPLRGSYLVGAPDLVIEIASPGDTHRMLAEKCEIYLRAGVRLLWVIWPKTQKIDVWQPSSLKKPITTLKENDLLDGAEVIPGFQCAVREIFS